MFTHIQPEMYKLLRIFDDFQNFPILLQSCVDSLGDKGDNFWNSRMLVTYTVTRKRIGPLTRELFEIQHIFSIYSKNTIPFPDFGDLDPFQRLEKVFWWTNSRKDE